MTNRTSRGLFDRTAAGHATSSVVVEVERGRIRSFANALGETNSIYLDVAAARNAGFPDLVAPPSFFVVLEALANETLLNRGERTAHEVIRCDNRYLLHGEEDYSYRGLVFAGEEVTVRTRVAEFYEKNEGALEFAALESTVDHVARGRLIDAKRVLVHKLPGGLDR